MGSSIYWERPGRVLLAERLLGPLRRHAVVGAGAVLLTLAFQLAFAALPPERAWNRALADASLVLFALTIGAGALLRLAGWKILFDIRRELGVWAALLAIAHVGVVLVPWLDLDTAALVRDAGYAMGNLVGVVALLYALILAVTSSDRAQRRLGTSWTRVQHGALTCYVLVGLHTAYFLFLEPWTGAEAAYAPKAMRVPFLAGAALLVALRTAAFWSVARRARQERV